MPCCWSGSTHCEAFSFNLHLLVLLSDTTPSVSETASLRFCSSLMAGASEEEIIPDTSWNLLPAPPPTCCPSSLYSNWSGVWWLFPLNQLLHIWAEHELNSLPDRRAEELPTRWTLPLTRCFQAWPSVFSRQMLISDLLWRLAGGLLSLQFTDSSICNTVND